MVLIRYPHSLTNSEYKISHGSIIKGFLKIICFSAFHLNQLYIRPISLISNEFFLLYVFTNNYFNKSIIRNFTVTRQVNRQLIIILRTWQILIAENIEEYLGESYNFKHHKTKVKSYQIKFDLVKAFIIDLGSNSLLICHEVFLNSRIDLN